MSIWRHQKFDPTAEYVVSKPLLFGNRDFKRGELFDVKTTTRQRRILYDGRFLRLTPLGHLRPDARAPESTSKSNGDLILDESEIEDLTSMMKDHGSVLEKDLGIEPDRVSQPAPITRRIVLAGRGWYNVEVGEEGCGNFINEKKLRLKEAEALSAQ